MHPHADLFAFALFPIPVGKQVQHRFLAPPGFVVEKIVLWKATCVDDAKLGADRRPAIRRGFAAVVEASPGEATREPFPGGIEFPPLLCQLRPRRMVQVISAHPITELVGFVNAAGWKPCLRSPCRPTAS